MGLLESLQNLVDIDIDIANTTEIHITSDASDSAVNKTDDGIELNLEALDSEQEEAVKSEIYSEWEQEGEILRDSARTDKEDIEEASEDERIQETLEYFDPLISDRHIDILEANLYLRKQWESDRHIPSNVLLRRRDDIAEKYGEEAYYIGDLAQAGYFDEGRYLRSLNEQMKEKGDYKEGEFREVFEEIVEHQPFTVFVSSSENVSQIVGKIQNKVDNYEKYAVDVSFIDIRGIGYKNRGKVKQAIERLGKLYSNFDADLLNEEPEIVVRIDPDSVVRD